MREEWHPAGFIDRLGADFIDGCFVGVVSLVAYLAVDRAILGSTADFWNFESQAMTVAAIAWVLWNWTYLVGTTGQSWGRRIAGLKVVGTDDQPIGFWRALGRNLFAVYISAAALNLGFLWVIWDPHK